jgi:3-dehydroquinate dehydratase/shikimate dehydrogenase
MGPPGVPTRLLPERFGSCWTYAGRSAPGQLAAAEMLDTYGFRRLTARTRVFGVAGRPVAASLSPVIHNAWFAAIGLDAVYVPLDTGSADDLLAFADWLPLDGISVTAPLKTEVFERVSVLDTVSNRVRAVNTIKALTPGAAGMALPGTRTPRRADPDPAGSTFGRPATLAAINTDVEGFLAPLRRRRFDLQGKRVAILGAGGASRAVAVACAGSGARVSVHARRLGPARLVASLTDGSASDAPPAAGSWDVLVNTTPLGSDAHAGENPAAGVPLDGELVYDLVSNPPVTPLLCDAAAAGCATVSGLEMLVAQAEAQAEWWTGLRPAPGLMRAAAERALKGSGG